MKISGIFISYAAVLILTAVAITTHFYDPKLLYRYCGEDSYVESLTVLFYAGSVLFFVLANSQSKFMNIWMWVFAFIGFFIAGEEISWGQRMFHFDSRLLSEHNVQQETNIHNLEGIHQNIRLLAVLVLAVLCFGIPWTNRLVARLKDFYLRIHLPVYPLWTCGIVAIAILLMAVPRLLTGKEIYNLDEMGEWYLSWTYLVFSFNTWRGRTG